MANAFLGLGANLGDRLANMQTALDLLPEIGALPVAVSRVYETEPWGTFEQPAYLNAVVKITTELQPEELLNQCLEIERRLGRIRNERRGPRTIDIDLLTYNDVERNTEHLTLPHPHMQDRAFVLAPLRDLAPDWVLPSGETVADRIGADFIQNQWLRLYTDGVLSIRSAG